MTIADRAVPVTGADRGIRLALGEEALSGHAVLIRPVDTDRTRGISKSSPESIARSTFDGGAKGEQDIVPGPTPESMVESGCNGAGTALECRNAAFARAEPVIS